MVPHYGIMELNESFLVMFSIDAEGNKSDQTQHWKAIQKAGATATKKDCKKKKLKKEDTGAKKSPSSDVH
eukprot:3017719-Ditylum_brightwellii.AAC.1